MFDIVSAEPRPFRRAVYVHPILLKSLIIMEFSSIFLPGPLCRAMIAGRATQSAAVGQGLAIDHGPGGGGGGRGGRVKHCVYWAIHPFP